MPTASTAIAINGKKSFYEKTIVNLLTKMQLGKLYLTLPGGETLEIGNGEGDITASVVIKNSSFFQRCMLYGDVGFGEAFVDGDWDTSNITNVIKWFLLNVDNAPTVSGSSTRAFILNALKFFNRISHIKRANSLNGSRKNISEHYDLNNDFLRFFLTRR